MPRLARPAYTIQTGTQVAQLQQHEASAKAVFTTFTSTTAFELGLALRARILSLPSSSRKPALISISLGTGSSDRVVFQCATEPGTIADNDSWVRRKRNTVLRWGMSTWAMRCKMLAATATTAQNRLAGPALEAEFAAKYAVDLPSYAIHGGGFPVRVRGVEGLVGVIVVSGLKQEDDHQVIVETVEQFIKAEQS